MKLEYIRDAFDGAGLILLYEGGKSEVAQLRKSLETLSTTGSTIAIHAFPFVEAVSKCRLTASSVKSDCGVTHASDGFSWELSSLEWENVHGLLEPFEVQPAPGTATQFQYLNRLEGPEVIYSTARSW